MCNGSESRTFKSVLAFHFVKEEFLCFCLGRNFRLASQTVSGRFLILHIPTLSKCVLLCKLLMGYTESIFFCHRFQNQNSGCQACILSLISSTHCIETHIWHSIVCFCAWTLGDNTVSFIHSVSHLIIYVPAMLTHPWAACIWLFYICSYPGQS